MAEFYRRVLDVKLPFEAGASKLLAIPRDRFIRRMILRGTIIGNTGASVSPHENAVLNVVKKLYLIADGADLKFNVSGFDLRLINIYDMSTQALTNSLTTTTGQTGITLGEFEIQRDFALLPRDLLDFSALLPAHMFNTLDLQCDWGTSADLGSGYTITGGEIVVQLLEVVPERGEADEVADLHLTTFEEALAVSQPDYGNVRDLPVGRFIKRIGLHAIRNGVRSNALVPAYKVVDKHEAKSYEVVKETWALSQHEDKVEHQLEALITGYTQIDFIAPYNTVGYKKGDLALQSTTSIAGTVNALRLIVEEIG